VVISLLEKWRQSWTSTTNGASTVVRPPPAERYTLTQFKATAREPGAVVKLCNMKDCRKNDLLGYMRTGTLLVNGRVNVTFPSLGPDETYSIRPENMFSPTVTEVQHFMRSHSLTMSATRFRGRKRIPVPLPE